MIVHMWDPSSFVSCVCHIKLMTLILFCKFLGTSCVTLLRCKHTEYLCIPFAQQRRRSVKEHRCSRPDILNITRELSRNLMKANQANLKAMRKVMTFCVNSKEHGISINPKGYWNGKAENDYHFEVLGISDSDYAKDLAIRKSVNGYVVYLNNSLISAKSKCRNV
jgi:hypothetical protein